MKIHTQPNADLQKLATLIQPMDGVAMLTSQDEDGALVSRPMAPLEMDECGAIWFYTDRASTKVEQLHTLNLSFSDAERGTYVSLCGQGALEFDLSHIKRLWTPLARPWFPEGTESKNLALLKFTPSAAEYWDAVDTKMVHLFATAVSVIVGRPIGMGQHSRIDTL